MTQHSTIAHRRHLAEEGLTRVGYGPGLELASFPPGQQRKIEKLLGELNTLRDLEQTSRQTQIDFYGERSWHGQFTRLAELEVAPGTRFMGESLRQLVWGALPDGPFKRFQEIFVDPRDRIVPHVSIQTLGGRRQISFAPDFDTRRASVLPCVISPDRVTESFLQTLGIADFSDLERRPTERLLRKGSLDVVNTLKRVWDSAMPLVEKHHRIFVIGRRVEAHESPLDSYPIPEESRGRLLVVRRSYEDDPGGVAARLKGGATRDLQVQVFDSPGAVLRRIHHLGAGYGRELETLKDLHGRLVQVHRALSGWSTLDEGERRALRRKLIATVQHTLGELEQAVDYSKQRAYELIEKTTIRDGRERDNPPRAQLLLMRSIEKLIDRLERARSKEGFIKIDERAVEALMLESDHKLRGYGEDIISAAAKLQRSAQGHVRPLGLEPRALAGLDVSPYREFGAALATRYVELTDAVVGGDNLGVQDALIKMHVVVKLYRVTREIERMKIRIARDPETTFEGIRNAVSGALQIFNERDPKTGVPTTRLFAHRHIEALDEPFNLIRNALRTLLEDVDAAGRLKFGGNLSPRAEAKRLESVRESLDQFGRGRAYDLLAALRRLP